MAPPVTTKGGLVRILIGNDADPIVYTAPCGLSSKSVTVSKNLEEVNLPDCNDPTKIDWIGRDATSLSMSATGEGVLAESAVETWLDAAENPDSVPVKIEMEFPATTWTWTGRMHVESAEIGAGSNTGRVTGNFSLQSDGEMVRTSAATT